MKLKKRVKITLTLILIVLFVLLGYLIYKNFFTGNTVEEVKVIDTIKDYGYELKDNKNETYKKMFYELEDILKEKEVDEEAYAKKIAEMFIYDFYSLEDKTAKTDIGGVDFVHPNILQNFTENAQSTYYKYVESNVYGNRKQSLPMVDKVTISNVQQGLYVVGDTDKDEEAFELKVTWTYTSNSFSDYQNQATLDFVHDGKKLQLVELK
ncbi:MAG: hypothetical protein IJ193_02700 [Bacilli bacterium]|nr:hypothetical protein [Bacilli bacterium]